MQLKVFLYSFRLIDIPDELWIIFIVLFGIKSVKIIPISTTRMFYFSSDGARSAEGANYFAKKQL